jgi:hypothetical protein
MDADEPIIVEPPLSGIDVSAVLWARLEKLAASLAAQGISLSPGEVGSQALSWALEQLGPDAIKKLAADMKANEEAGA